MLKKIRHSKKGIVATMLVCAAAVVTMTSSRDNGKGNGPAVDDPNDINQHPPVAENVFAQVKSNGTGGNVLLEIKFKQEERLRITPLLQMIGADGVTVTTLRDDGKSGDAKPGDFVFSSFITEDITEFVATMEDLNKQLEASRNNLIVFDRRSGSNVTRATPFFNSAAFLAGQKMEISKDIFSLQSSNPDQAVKPVGVKVLRKEYCKGTVARSTGFQFTPVSPASIGRGYGPPPPPAPICYTIKKEYSLFITDLAVVEDPARTFNPCAGTGNANGAWTFKTLMDGLANFGSTGISTQKFTFYWLDNWIQDLTINGEVVKNRAQKTIDMIVGPWIERGSGGAIPASTVTIWNWKQLWFQVPEDKLMAFSPFKLTAIVNRGDLRGNGGYTPGVGKEISQGETRFIYSAINILKGVDCGKPIGDKCFEGFNVIFEYRNIKFDCNFALQWMNLSKPGLVLGSATYNTMLEAITKTVTAPNAAPGRPNGSAISQVRTNEIALTNTVDNLFDDRSPRWQFREFRIQTLPSGLLDEVALTNEVAGKYNGADGGNPALMSNWVNANTGAILTGTASVPNQFLGFDFRAGKSNYPSVSQFSAPGYWDGNAANPIINDQARHQFSVNNCSGCHAPKDGGGTIFTHVNTVGLGTQMRYVGIMDYVTDGVDTKTQISPFLTGRNYNFAANSFADAKVNAAEDLTDNSLTGLYYVSDAAGRIDGMTGNPYLRGFNDLERRAQDLANFVLANRCCKAKFTHLIKFAATAFFQPLNMSH
jgi:hypothetical protein